MKNSLKKDFELRNFFYTNRASAIFPILFVNKLNDLYLSYLNYWKIKNKIDQNKLLINLRIYDQNGNIAIKKEIKNIHENNIISIRNFITKDQFSGMVEIEILSTLNLRFNFPAVIGIYKSKSYYSCVHSAGRIKGSDENHTPIKTEETNWSCKFQKNITPFFHFVNGNIKQKIKFEVILYSSYGHIIEKKIINNQFNSFASKIYFVENIFSKKKIKSKCFIGVRCLNDNVFRRMVVGNYFKNIHHLEVTHSFPWQTKIDHCPNNNKGSDSFLAIYRDKKLNVEARVFPTNCKANYTITAFTQKFREKKINFNRKKILKSKNLNNIYLTEEDRFKTLHFKGKVPSRLNSNFIYSIKNKKFPFSTDIATGAKSTVYPKKNFHWGSGIIGNGYNFVIMLRNNNHNKNAPSCMGKLKLFGLNTNKEFQIKFNGESSLSIKLSDLIKNKSLISDKKVKIFTWLFKTNNICVETFWVSYRSKDGCILGDHGF